ncbi:Repressor of filamentous growth 1 [Escovopsis weberi]|uniref:Repressor of filamentous growth 1 n=1 Tax=Escovopsis weberi TaxID=150374 RepID=A0A0M9VUY7_ESCWE|nr:Repressor of filamentous growth 1 [Escovopsis weberi]
MAEVSWASEQQMDVVAAVREQMNIDEVASARGVAIDGLGQMRVNAAMAMDPMGYRDMICMCIQTPRIPRPRNAFILYRQYHQSRVMSENPSLSNPEISRIIGDKWKNEEPDVKEDWKGMAEKEKQRHASRYPNYRYQPRRNVKSQSWAASSPLEEERGRCPKCKGRLSSLTPRTPTDPYASPTASWMGGAHHPLGQEKTTPGLSRLDTDVPRGMSSGSVSPLTMANRLPLPSPYGSFMSADGGAMSPDSRRRRTSSIADYHLVGRRPEASPGGYLMRDARRLGQEAGGWGASDRPFEGWRPQDHERGTDDRNGVAFDESLRLPPLRTPISPRSQGIPNDGRFNPFLWETSASPATRADADRDRDNDRDRDRGKGPAGDPEFSFRDKLGVLARVCRPAPVPPPPEGSGVRATRGPFIAIEGADARALGEVGAAVERALLGCEDVHLRTWSLADQLANGQAPALPAEVLKSCLETLERGQDMSRQIASHVTQGEEGTADGRPGRRLPVALVKDGFSMTLTDGFASMASGAGAGAGADDSSLAGHWSWMASLWRGAVSPDLVLYIKNDLEDAEDADGGEGGEEGGRHCRRRRRRRRRPSGTLELWKQLGLMVVRTAKDGSVGEDAGRALVTELMGWIREGSYREAVAEDWRA